MFVPRGRGWCRRRPRCSTCPKTASDQAIDRLARTGDCAIDASVVEDARAPAVYEAGLYRAECALAAGLRKLLATPAPRTEIDRERAIAWYEREAGIALARQQVEAVSTALSAKVAVITGGPGVGKTTIVRGIVSILEKKGVQRRAGGAHRARRQAARRGDRARRRRRCTACSSGGPPRRASRATRPGRWSSTC